MPDQEKKALDVKSLEVTELEDADLEEVSGGATNPNTACNESCPQTVNSGCPQQLPQLGETFA